MWGSLRITDTQSRYVVKATEKCPGLSAPVQKIRPFPSGLNLLPKSLLWNGCSCFHTVTQGRSTWSCSEGLLFQASGIHFTTVMEKGPMHQRWRYGDHSWALWSFFSLPSTHLPISPLTVAVALQSSLVESCPCLPRGALSLPPSSPL